MADEQAGKDLLIRSFWMAPEVIKTGTCSPAGDIWSLGILAIEVLQKYPPYFHDGALKAMCRILSSGVPLPLAYETYSKDLKCFLRTCLAMDAKQRGNANELLQVSDFIVHQTSYYMCFV